jgi:alpha-1,6-mannosyltransferase
LTGSSHKKQIILVLSTLLFMAALLTMGYFLPRSAFFLQLSMFSLAFLAYWVLYRLSKEGTVSIPFGLGLAFFSRLLLLFAIPELSDDFYRFIFDGQLIKSGINPYAFLPEVAFTHLDIKEVGGYWQSLIEGMNSRSYFSIYPPLHQFFFWLSSLAGESLMRNILILRLVILGFEGLNFYLIFRITKDWNLPESRLWLYAFNPLVILELSGNLHFEGIVLTGLLTTLYFFGKKKLLMSNLGWVWAVGVKLTPLMFGPVLLKFWGKDKRWGFIFAASGFILLFFWPLFLGDSLVNYWQSFRLYQSKFEFNASIYYLIRWISGFFVDYNPIVYVGPFLNYLALALILGISLFRKMGNARELAAAILWIYLCYLLLQTVVHPWYIIPAFGISVLSNNRIFLIWSGLVFLSYSAYADEMRVIENQFLLILEYGVLVGFIYWNYLKRFVQP